MNETVILVVDDEHNTREGIQMTLQRWSKGQYRIITAEHGLEALDMLQRNKVDLLLTDIRMPGMDGIQLIEAVREQAIEVTMILLTGYAEFEYAKRALHLGVSNYLLKPVEQQQLIEAVEEGLARNKAHQRRIWTEKLVGSSLDKLQDKEAAGRNPFIQKALEFIESSEDLSFGIKEVAAAVHLNPSYFSVLFKEVMNTTFSEYATQIRMKKAKELLITSSLDMFDIASSIGYQTTSYFIKVFKEQEGMTPKQFRDRFHEG